MTCLCSVTPATKHSISWHWESQDHLERKDLQRPPDIISCSKYVQWEWLALPSCVLNISKNADSTIGPFSSIWSLSRKKEEKIPYINRNSHVLVCPFCHPVTLHRWCCHLFSLHKAIVEMRKVSPEPLLRPSKFSSSSFSLCIKVFQPQTTSVALCWTLSNMPKSFLYWRAKKLTQHSSCRLPEPE